MISWSFQTRHKLDKQDIHPGEMYVWHMHEAYVSSYEVGRGHKGAKRVIFLNKPIC